MANLGTEVVASSLDRRSDTLGRHPTWEKKLTFFTDDGGHTEVTLTISSLNGILQKIIVVIPVTTATGATATFTIDDNADNEIFNSGALAENDTYLFNVSEPLAGNIDFGLDLSKDPTGDGHTVTVYLRGV